MTSHSFCAIGLAVALVSSPAAAATPAKASDLQTIIDGERAWGQAFVHGDVAEIDRLLADDFIGVDTHGKRYDKAAAMKDVRNGPSLTSDDITNLVVRFYGDTAVAQGDEHEVGPAPDKRVFERVFTDSWVKLNGQWRIVAAEDLDPTR